MKTLAIIAILLVCGSVGAQSNRFPPINIYSGDPTGVACTIPNRLVQSDSTGGLYSCVGGHYKGRSVAWGSIQGNLSDQTDLQTALGAKWNTPTFANVVALWASGACSGYLKSDGTCGTSAAVMPGWTSTGSGATQVDTAPGIVAAGASVSAPQHCIGASCITAWPTGGQPTTAISFGDSITVGYGITSPTTNGYEYLAARTFGILPSAVTNRGVTGSMACDVINSAMTNDNPTITLPQPLRTVMVGTNDTNQKTSAYYPVFNACYGAIMTWETIPASSKKLVASAATTGTCSAGVCTASGSTITFSGASALTTTGAPIYLWVRYVDGDAGTWTYSVDGGSAVSVNTALSVPIATNFSNTGYGVIRVPIAAGSHSVLFTQTTSGTMGVVGIGTVPPQPATNPYNIFNGLPYLIVNQIPTPVGANLAGFRAQLAANFATYAGDGLNLIWGPVDQFYTGTQAFGDWGDTLHPNINGHVEIANATLAGFSKLPLLPLNATPVLTEGYCNLTSQTGNVTLAVTCPVSFSNNAALTGFTFPALASVAPNSIYSVINETGNAVSIYAVGGVGMPTYILNGMSFSAISSGGGYWMPLSTYYIPPNGITYCNSAGTTALTVSVGCQYTYGPAITSIAFPTPSTLLNNTVYTVFNGTGAAVSVSAVSGIGMPTTVQAGGSISALQAGGSYWMPVANYNPAVGFTGTKTAGTCVLTISSGLITAVSGC